MSSPAKLLMAKFASKQACSENSRPLNKQPRGELIPVEKCSHAQSQYMQDNKAVHVLVTHYSLHGFKFKTWLANAYEDFIEENVKSNAQVLNESIQDGEGMSLCYYGAMNKRHISRLHPKGDGKLIT